MSRVRRVVRRVRNNGVVAGRTVPRHWDFPVRAAVALVALLGMLAMHGLGSDHDLGMTLAAAPADSPTAMVNHSVSTAPNSSVATVDGAGNAGMPTMAMTGCVATLRSVGAIASAPPVSRPPACADVAAGAVCHERVRLSTDPRPPDLTRLGLSRT